MAPIAMNRHQPARRGASGPLLLAGALASFLLPAADRAWADQPRPQVVYGSDDRREVFGLSGAKAAAAASTVAIVDTSRLTRAATGSRLATERLGPRRTSARASGSSTSRRGRAAPASSSARTSSPPPATASPAPARSPTTASSSGSG
jgi:hypothetical protein